MAVFTCDSITGNPQPSASTSSKPHPSTATLTEGQVLGRYCRHVLMGMVYMYFIHVHTCSPLNIELLLQTSLI